MKNLIAIFSLLFISSSFANCFQDFGGEEHSMYNSEQHDVMYTDDVLLSESGFISSLGTLGFDYESCKDAIEERVLTAQSGNDYTFILTNKDHCDGGNTYGLIYNSERYLVGTIQDGEVYCSQE